jgi:hypothetical protein
MMRGLLIMNSPEPLFCYPALDELTPRVPNPPANSSSRDPLFRLNRGLRWNEYKLVDWSVNREMTYSHVTVQ